MKSRIFDVASGVVTVFGVLLVSMELLVRQYETSETERPTDG